MKRMCVLCPLRRATSMAPNCTLRRASFARSDRLSVLSVMLSHICVSTVEMAMPCRRSGCRTSHYCKYRTRGTSNQSQKTPLIRLACDRLMDPPFRLDLHLRAMEGRTVLSSKDIAAVKALVGNE